MASFSNINFDLPPSNANLSNSHLHVQGQKPGQNWHAWLHFLELTPSEKHIGVNFCSHIYNDIDINSTIAATLQENCPFSSGDNLAPFDVQRENSFDNDFY